MKILPIQSDSKSLHINGRYSECHKCNKGPEKRMPKTANFKILIKLSYYPLSKIIYVKKSPSPKRMKLVIAFVSKGWRYSIS